MATKTDAFDLDPLIAEYCATFASTWAPNTRAIYDRAFRLLRDWLAQQGRPCTTDSLTFPILSEFVARLKTTPRASGVWRGDRRAVERSRHAPGQQTLSLNTVNAYMRSIRAFVSWLVGEGQLARDPFRRFDRRTGPNPLLPHEETPTKGATLLDIERLERGCRGSGPLDLRDQAIVSVLKTTTARNSVVRLLRLDDIDFERDLITFRRGKAQKTLEVALQPETKAALLRFIHRGRRQLMPRYPVRGLERVVVGADPGWLFIARDNGRGNRTRPLSANGLSQMLTRRYRAGGGDMSFFGSHRIRHGAATLLANNGMPIDELSRFMGHSSTDVTRRYARHTPQALGSLAADAMARSGLAGGPRRRRTA